MLRWFPGLVALLVLVSACLPGLDPDPRLLVTIESHGGLCADGGECRSTIQIRSDGAIVRAGAQPSIVAHAGTAQIARLESEIAAADLRALASRKFTGTCPTAYDGQEIVYRFPSPTGEIRLASCEVELDPTHPLFEAIAAVLSALGGS
jgi:hypothetical protein